MWRYLLLGLASIFYSSFAFSFDDPQLDALINREYAHCEVIPHASVFSSPFVDELSMYNVCVGEVLEKIHEHINAVKRNYKGASFAVLGGDFDVAHKKDIEPTVNKAIQKKYYMLKGYHLVGRDMCLYERKDQHKGSCYRVMLN